MRTLLTAMAVLLLATSTMLVKVSLTNRNLVQRSARRELPAVPQSVPTMRLPTITGDSIEIAGGKRQTLLILKTDCAFCNETLPVWREIFHADAEPGSLVVLSLDSPELTEEYLSENPLPFPAASIRGNVKQLLGLGAVPQILVLNRRGKIVYSRIGTLAGVPSTTIDSIRDHL